MMHANESLTDYYLRREDDARDEIAWAYMLRKCLPLLAQLPEVNMQKLNRELKSGAAHGECRHVQDWLKDYLDKNNWLVCDIPQELRRLLSMSIGDLVRESVQHHA